MSEFLIVDDHALVRRALVRMLSSSFPKSTIGEATSAKDAVSMLEAQPWI